MKIVAVVWRHLRAGGGGRTGIAAFLLSSGTSPRRGGGKAKAAKRTGRKRRLHGTSSLEEDVGAPPDKSDGKRLVAVQDAREKSGQEEKAMPSRSRRPLDKSQKGEPPKPAGTEKPPPKSIATGHAPAGGEADAGSAPKAQRRAAPPKKPEPPAKPVEPVKPKPVKPVSLDGLEAAVDLPQPGKGADEAVSLGKLDLDPKPERRRRVARRRPGRQRQPQVRFAERRRRGNAGLVGRDGREEQGPREDRPRLAGGGPMEDPMGRRSDGQGHAASLLRPAIFLRNRRRISSPCARPRSSRRWRSTSVTGDRRARLSIDLSASRPGPAPSADPALGQGAAEARDQGPGGRQGARVRGKARAKTAEPVVGNTVPLKGQVIVLLHEREYAARHVRHRASTPAART